MTVIDSEIKEKCLLNGFWFQRKGFNMKVQTD